ncbi:conserved hypothetical protein [Ixodes scapularis]|uniref:Uncharacterized protein n=1 Tax=Ixodes scapularis TaxID=6945 RepID=B7QD74_IXOSC|nr:conserved hypothetical protein [Ixodes scapularis]|eukprot:XP_002413488.1 conserved hypothetical protein [Ixodes scapularis]
MLTEREQQGLAKIIGALELPDVIALAQTVTCKQIKLTDRSEAERAILSGTQSPADLLRRKKILRELLFRYLWSESVFVAPALAKSDLIHACLQHWQALPDGVSTNTATPFSHGVSSESSFQEKLGLEFTNWFFAQLNAESDKLGHQHFFSNCSLKVAAAQDSSPSNLLSIRGSEAASRFLWQLAGGSRRMFHPNIRSVKCQVEDHGMARIQVSGVIHEYRSCVGLFDCTFGLVRDPAAAAHETDIWKLQFVEVRLRVSRLGSVTAAVVSTSAQNDVSMDLECS